MAMPHEHRPLTWRERLGLPPATRVRPVWWRPPWGLLLRHAGWWWIPLVGPPMIGIASLMIAILGGQPYSPLGWIGIRILTIWIIVPLIARANLNLKVMRLRADPYCLHCGYTLTGLLAQVGRPGLVRDLAGRLISEFAANLSRRMSGVVSEHGAAAELSASDWPQLLLKYVVSHPAVTCAIPGTTKVEHLEDDQGASHGRLANPSELKQLEEYWDRVIAHPSAV